MNVYIYTYKYTLYILGKKQPLPYLIYHESIIITVFRNYISFV